MTFHENSYLSWYIPRMLGGRDAINLHSSGVPPLNPKNFCLALDDTWGLSARFESAVINWLGIPAGELIFTPGATGGTLLALLTLVDSHQGVLVESPIYEPMLRQTRRLAQVRRLIRSPENGWRLPLDQARELMNDGTAMVMLTEPHNPSGVFSPRDDVMELAAIATEYGATLLINEVYRGFTERPSYHGAAANIVIVNSLSKLFGTYWMRLGWLSAPEGIATKLRHGHTNMGMPTAPAAGLGISVMEKAAELQESARDTSRKGFPVVNAWVERTDGVSWHAPQGIGFGCITIPGGIDDVVFAEYLFAKKQVLLVPGTKFEVPGTLRISWLQSGDRLEEGLQRLSEGLKQPPRE